ncbi:MAG TPA: DUF2252 domain-containing protein [Patescibacteria group bacterium]|nr:DUF2252 domain-containing protein [Patescibacteria group bacterium]
MPRRSHAEWQPTADRPDPIDLLERQASDRTPELVPIRYGRMLTSPFAFYRGAAAIMAADLATTPRTGLNVQLCGDAHLSNFGAFTTPDRAHIFDINDFDETLPGPWEWDIKRLVASFEVAAREFGFDRAQREAVLLACARTYRTEMAGFGGMRHLDVWYAREDTDRLLQIAALLAKRSRIRVIERDVARARTKDSFLAFSKLTKLVDGEPRFRANPPLLVPVEDLLGPDQLDGFNDTIRRFLGGYRTSLPDDRRRVFDGYRYAHMARKVVGVGSVGTRAWVALLLGRNHRDPLILQLKEAQLSVLEPYLGESAYKNHGRRVVEGQRLMQSSSDIFLGWYRLVAFDGKLRDFYVRQLWDGKYSPDVETMNPALFTGYARLCGRTLARAHARSGDRIGIAAYLGQSVVFDQAMVGFAVAYADQNERDFEALKSAVAAGRIAAEHDV